MSTLLVPWRRWTFILVAGPLAGDGGFLLPPPFCQGDGRYSFIGFDSLGGVLGDVSCCASKAWSPLPGGGWIWTDAVAATANWRPEMRKMTMRPEDSFVIFLFFGGQFVKGGCTVLMFIFNISSLSQKKRSVALYKPPNYPVIINLIISHE